MLQLFTKKAKGFTLIELLVVIAVIGILAGIVLVNMGPVRQRARDSRRVSDVAQIGTALGLYYDGQSTPRYATALSQLSPTYLTIVPTDPQSGSAYTYTPSPTACDNVATNCTSYCLYAVPEDTSKGYPYSSPSGSGYDNGTTKTDCNPST